MAEEKHGTRNVVITALAVVLAAAVSGFFTNNSNQAKYDVMEDKFTRADAQLKDVKGREDKWKFSAPLYRLIPGDNDFLARQLRVDKKQGAQMLVVGPNERDRYAIIITSLLPQGKDSAGNQQYAVLFTVEGRIGTNIILGEMSDPVLMSPNALAGPLNVLTHEFYIYVDRVDIDYVYLTIARRPIMLDIRIEGAVGSFGMLRVYEKRPEPILIVSP